MRKSVVAVAGGLCVAAAIAVAVASMKAPAEDAPFVASYFFDEARFNNVKPGMTKNDVRDLVGPALSQRRVSGLDIQVWTYSSMPSPVEQHTEFEVRFNRADKVVSTHRDRHTQQRDEKTGRYSLSGARPPQRPLLLSDFNPEMISGDKPQFAVGQQRYLIQVMASWCPACHKSRPEVEALLSRDTSSPPLKLLLVSIDEDEQALRGYIKRNGITCAVAWDARNSLPGFRRSKEGEGIPRYAILQDGVLAWFDFEHSEHADSLADLEWFMKYPHFAKQVTAANPGS